VEERKEQRVMNNEQLVMSNEQRKTGERRVEKKGDGVRGIGARRQSAVASDSGTYYEVSGTGSGQGGVRRCQTPSRGTKAGGGFGGGGRPTPQARGGGGDATSGGWRNTRRRRVWRQGGRTTRWTVSHPPFRERRAPLLIMPVRLRFACRSQRRLLPNNE
jgi:hypothetical protein